MVVGKHSNTHIKESAAVETTPQEDISEKLR